MEHLSPPNSRLNLRAVVYASVALAVLAMGGCVGWIIMRSATIVDQRVFTGTLTQEADPVAVQLPAGAVVADIPVHDGDQVREGQTLVRFDTELLQYQINERQLDILGLRMERACVLDPNQPVPDGTADLVAEAQVQLRFAQERCRSFHAPDLQETTKRAAHLRAIQAEQDILRRNTGRLEVAFAQGDGTEDRLDQFLRTLIVRRDLDAQQREAEASVQAFEQGVKDRRLAKALALNSDIRAANSVLHVLERLRDNPRITAPVSGAALRVRPMSSGTQVQSTTEVMQIIAGGSSPFQLQMIVPVDVARQMTADQTLLFSVSGFDGRDQLDLSAHWPEDGLHPGIDGDSLSVTLQISEESQRLLAERADDLNRWQGGARAEVRLNMAPANLADVIRGAFAPAGRNLSAIATIID